MVVTFTVTRKRRSFLVGMNGLGTGPPAPGQPPAPAFLRLTLRWVRGEGRRKGKSLEERGEAGDDSFPGRMLGKGVHFGCWMGGH